MGVRIWVEEIRLRIESIKVELIGIVRDSSECTVGQLDASRMV